MPRTAFLGLAPGALRAFEVACKRLELEVSAGLFQEQAQQTLLADEQAV